MRSRFVLSFPQKGLPLIQDRPTPSTMRTIPLNNLFSLYSPGNVGNAPVERPAHGRPFRIASYRIATGDSYAMRGMAACLPTRIGSSVGTSETENTVEKERREKGGEYDAK